MGVLLSALAAGCSDSTRTRLPAGTPVIVHSEKWSFALMVCDDGKRKTMVQVPVGTHAIVVSDDADEESPDRAVGVAIKEGEHIGEGQVGRRYLKRSPGG